MAQIACPKLGLMLLMAAVAGCGGNVEAQLEAYVEALQEIRTGPSSAPPAPALEPYPDRGSLRLALPDLRVGLLEFIGLDQRCGVGTLIAGRNSALGKVMPVSQRLIYEQTLLLELRDCVASLRARDAEPEEIAEVEGLLQRKSAQLPRVFWNATVAGPEFEKMFSLSGAGQLDRASLESAGGSTREALDFLVASYPNLGADGRFLDQSALETHLQNLTLEGFGGRVLETMAVLTAGLEQAAILVEAPTEAESCGELRSLHQDHVQAWLRPLAGRLAEVAGGFLDRVNRVVELPREHPDQTPLVDLVEPFQRYRRSFLAPQVDEGLWRQFQRARERHRQAWQSRLARCDQVYHGSGALHRVQAGDRDRDIGAPVAWRTVGVERLELIGMARGASQIGLEARGRAL